MPSSNYNSLRPTGKPYYKHPNPTQIMTDLVWGATAGKRATSDSRFQNPIDPMGAAQESLVLLNKESGIYGLGSMLEEQNVMNGELSGLGDLAALGADGKIANAACNFFNSLSDKKVECPQASGDSGGWLSKPIPLSNVLLILGGSWILWKLFERAK